VRPWAGRRRAAGCAGRRPGHAPGGPEPVIDRRATARGHPWTCAARSHSRQCLHNSCGRVRHNELPQIFEGSDVLARIDPAKAREKALGSSVNRLRGVSGRRETSAHPDRARCAMSDRASTANPGIGTPDGLGATPESPLGWALRVLRAFERVKRFVPVREERSTSIQWIKKRRSHSLVAQSCHGFRRHAMEICQDGGRTIGSSPGLIMRSGSAPFWRGEPRRVDNGLPVDARDQSRRPIRWGAADPGDNGGRLEGAIRRRRAHRELIPSQWPFGVAAAPDPAFPSDTRRSVKRFCQRTDFAGNTTRPLVIGIAVRDLRA